MSSPDANSPRGLVISARWSNLFPLTATLLCRTGNHPKIELSFRVLQNADFLFGDLLPWGGESLDMSTVCLSAFRIPGKFVCAFLGTLAIAASLAGCGGYGGGGSSNYPITVSVSPTSASVPISQTKQFTATVAYDSQYKGVTWALSGTGCSGSACGTLSANMSASGVAITYTAPATVPIPAAVTLTATFFFFKQKTAY